MTDGIDESTSREAGQKRRRAGSTKLTAVKPSDPPVAEVIHLRFGKGGGRVPPPDPKASESPPISDITADPEPVSDVFTRREVARLLRVSESRLRTLDRAGVVSPSASRGERRLYTFQDLIALRATRELLAHKIRVREVAAAIFALRKSLPRVTRPLQELRVVSDGKRVVVRAEGAAFEPVSGQLMFDFDVTALRDDVVRVLRPSLQPSLGQTAYDLYLRASELDESPATWGDAEALYRKAIAIDPGLAIAYTNLGNVRFRQDDEAEAVVLYRRALDIDPEQPEAHYNLGYVLLEHGNAKGAVVSFVKALRGDPRFADAHFNIAMAYEQLGQVDDAKSHWRKYLELESRGTWADIAREHL